MKWNFNAEQGEEITYLDLAQVKSEKGSATASTHEERMEWLEELKLNEEIRKLRSEQTKESGFSSFVKTAGEVCLKVAGAACIALLGIKLQQDGTLFSRGSSPEDALSTMKKL